MRKAIIPTAELSPALTLLTVWSAGPAPKFPRVVTLENAKAMVEIK